MSESDLLEEFGANLQSVLDDSGISRNELAEFLNTDKSSISRYIRGERMPSLKTIVNIMAATDCEFDDLICDVERVY